MVDASSWVSHIEAFVDTTRPAEQQKAGIDAVVVLVKNDFITLETLVREMELYLTTIDDAIRAQGILFLAEVLVHLLKKSFDSFTLSTLAGFFSARLADWRSLHGALVGCLALLRRKSNVGMLVDSDAKILAQSMLDNVQVQFLALIDRKICFEVFQCLLDVYCDSVATLGDAFVYGLIQAVDQEKDPRCLVLTFNLIQSLVKLFVSQLGCIHIVRDLFEVLSCYFPIYFTHKVADDFEVRREDLSVALMHAFCSTPHFEPFAIPLLLDKLSSSLPLAKIDSLKYLNKCILSYGADKMAQHAHNIWFALKGVILSPLSQEETLSLSSILGGVTDSEEHEITREALMCLKTILQFTCLSDDAFLTLIIDDSDIERIFYSVTMEESYSDNSDKIHLQLSALGSILSVMANSSIFCCNRVISIFFSRLMDIIGLHSRYSEHIPDVNFEVIFRNLNFGALYLCVELLTSCRELIATTWETSIQKNSLKGGWWHMIQDFSSQLVSTLRHALMLPNKITAECVYTSSKQDLVLYSVKGLEVLATYPGEYIPVTKESLENILVAFMSVIIGRSEETFLWKLSLRSLVQIGSSFAKFKDSHMQRVYNEIVVKRLVLLLHEDSILSLSLKLEAITEIATCSLDFISRVIQGLEEAMFSNFLHACVDGSSKCTKDLVILLDSYTTKVLPWCRKSGSIEQPGMRFTINILEQMENVAALKMEPEMQDLLDKMMVTMKLVVSGCTEDNQHIILEKAYNIMLASTDLPSASLLFCFSISQGLQFIPDLYEITCRNKWLLYIFSSIVIALRPQAPLASVAKLRNILLLFTLKGHLPAAQALASLINKLPSNVDKVGCADVDILEESVEMIFETFSIVLSYNSQNRPHMLSNNEVTSMLYSNLQVHAVAGMAWIGKALIMRGHGRLKDISMVILKLLLSGQSMIISASNDLSHNCIGEDMQYLVARSAADAFHILLSESEACLNKNFHAIIRPLYKQRFFSSMLPVLHSAIKECKSSKIRVLLYQAFGHIISAIPLVVLVADKNKVLPLLLDALSVLDLDISNKDLIYSLLLVLSGFLIDEKGKEEIIDSAHIVINHLIKLIFYPHKTLVRETAIECLTALTSLPYTRIYPLRTQVLDALSRAFDDKKRIVRREAVKCHHAWSSMTSGSLGLR